MNNILFNCLEKQNQSLPPAGEREGGFYHLGTITHMKTGSTITEFSFDAWGRRRNALNWSYDLTGQPALFADRGFTNHEFLADFNLYNMNGRLYDPVVGRFLSPDPYIQNPSFSQSYNRYSYCLNNPLKFTDYSGEKLNWPKFEWFHAIPLIGHFDYMVQMVNDNTPKLRKNMVNAKIPDFGVNYNTMFGTGFSVGDNPAYYPGYEKRISDGQRNISNHLVGFSGMGANTDSPRFGNGDIINQQISEEDYFQIYGELSISLGPQLGFELSLGTPILAGFLQGPSVEVKYKPYLRFSKTNGWSAGIDIEKNNINYKKGYSYPLYSYEKYNTYGVYEHPAFSKSTIEIQKGVIQTKNIDGTQNGYFRTHWGPYVRPLIFGVGVDFGFEGPFDY